MVRAMSPLFFQVRRLFAVFATAALAACASPTPAPIPPAPEQAPQAAITAITFEAGPCYGFCPIFTVTVSANGAIRYQGQRFTALQGAHSLEASPALFQRLSEIAVSPSLPWPRGDVLPGRPTCGMEVSDLPSYRLAVSGARQRQFNYYAGCSGPEAARARRIVDAVMQALAAHGVPTEGVAPQMRDEPPPPERLPE
jgi:hypothetical protein